MMKRICLFCQKELPQDAHGSRKYCSFKCTSAFNKAKYRGLNPNDLKGNSPATTGAISELRVSVDLLSKGYNVFRALSPNAPCDLAVLRDGKLLKIEVRTTHISYVGKPYKTKSKKDDPNNIDHYAWVLPNEIIYEPMLE